MLHFLIIFSFFMSLSSFASMSQVKICGDVNLDYLIWKRGNIDTILSSVFFKETNITIKSAHVNDVNCYLNFEFSPQKLEYLIKEAYIKIKKPQLILKFGKIYPFYDLEDITSSTNRRFMEKASLKGFEEKNLFGLMINYISTISNFFYYLVTPELSPLNNKTQPPKFSSFLRFFIKLNNQDTIWHFGINYKELIRNQYDDAKYTSVSITDTPFFMQAYPYSRTHYTALPSYRVVGYEIIGLLQSLCIQIEALFSRAGWKDFDPELYNSITLQLSYILTGEHHKYDFHKGTIKNPQTNAPLGAFEITFRHSFSDTTSKNSLISGVCKTDSYKHTFNVGLNWHLNTNVKIQLNYTYESIIYRLIDDKKIHSFGMGLRFSF
ncbi:MAG TPA: porin [Candidatus Azoamicus sp. OHIO2]